jgi:flagellar hook assembly protein FlgD
VKKKFNETTWLFLFTVLFSTHTLCQIPLPQLPTQFKLYQNSPEPFDISSGTNIPFDIASQSFVKIWIEDNNKSLVATLVSINLKAGRYQVQLDVHNYSEGLYICKMEADSQGTSIFRDSILMHCQKVTSVLNGNRKSYLSEFQLQQNYPNPFNPTTRINYFVLRSSLVTLKVYDILGKEISTLVNEEKPVGNYKVDFDGSNLSSGVYFYRMQAGSFIDTKKFILIR